MNPILELVIKEIPNIVDLIKEKHVMENPNLPPLTDLESLMILKQAIDSSIAKDDSWLSVHGDKA